MSTLNKKLTSFFKNGHWGIVNAEGRIIIPACYDAILGFDYNESAHLFLFSVKICVLFVEIRNGISLTKKVNYYWKDGIKRLYG